MAGHSKPSSAHPAGVGSDIPPTLEGSSPRLCVYHWRVSAVAASKVGQRHPGLHDAVGGVGLRLFSGRTRCSHLAGRAAPDKPFGPAGVTGTPFSKAAFSSWATSSGVAGLAA